MNERYGKNNPVRSHCGWETATGKGQTNMHAMQKELGSMKFYLGRRFWEGLGGLRGRRERYIEKQRERRRERRREKREKRSRRGRELPLQKWVCVRVENSLPHEKGEIGSGWRLSLKGTGC